ncbi:hypothetical protein [Rhodoblastus sp.]|uniref:hypothetical protein n=1 Tax=Rhodoblastus sp. TaxID=1962975 RepID=UPI003F9A8297
MSTEEQIAELRQWLKEDETRMQGGSPTPSRWAALDDAVRFEFNDFGQAPPGSPFVQWNQWGQ